MFNIDSAADAAVDATAMPAAADSIGDLPHLAHRLGRELRELLQRIELHVNDQHEHASATSDIDEMQRLADADPYRWLADAKHSLQAGMMFVDRAMAQPVEF